LRDPAAHQVCASTEAGPADSAPEFMMGGRSDCAALGDTTRRRLSRGYRQNCRDTDVQNNNRQDNRDGAKE
jgi:hypothetical protein